MRKLNATIPKNLEEFQTELNRYLPDATELIIWGRYCTHIGFPDRFTQRILTQEKVGFAGTLFSSEHNQSFRTEGSVAKLERDPADNRRFILNIDGVSVFQWFRDMARKVLEKIGFKTKEQKRGSSLSR